VGTGFAWAFRNCAQIEPPITVSPENRIFGGAKAHTGWRPASKRRGIFCEIYTRGPRAHECAGLALEGSVLPKLPTGSGALHLGPHVSPICPLCLASTARGEGQVARRTKLAGRWHAQGGPAGRRKGALLCACPTGQPGKRGMAGRHKGAQRGLRGAQKRKCDTHTDRQTLNKGLVGNIVVQVRQPPLRGCTWGS